MIARFPILPQADYSLKQRETRFVLIGERSSKYWDKDNPEETRENMRLLAQFLIGNMSISGSEIFYEEVKRVMEEPKRDTMKRIQPLFEAKQKFEEKFGVGENEDE
jgi:hypothetical protein